MVSALLIQRSGGELPWSSSIPLLEGREQGGKVAMYYALLILTSGGELSWSLPHPSLFQEEGSKEGVLFGSHFKAGVDHMLLVSMSRPNTSKKTTCNPIFLYLLQITLTCLLAGVSSR